MAQLYMGSFLLQLLFAPTWYEIFPQFNHTLNVGRRPFLEFVFFCYEVLVIEKSKKASAWWSGLSTSTSGGDGDPGVVVINHNWETSHVTASFEMQNRSVETEASGRRIHHQYQSNSHNEATQRQEGNIAAVNRKYPTTFLDLKL